VELGDVFRPRSGRLQHGKDVAEGLCGLFGDAPGDRAGCIGAVLPTDVQGASGIGDDSLGEGRRSVELGEIDVSERHVLSPSRRDCK
jgi:hypothetical protein